MDLKPFINKCYSRQTVAKWSRFDCLAPNYEHCTFYQTYKVPTSETKFLFNNVEINEFQLHNYLGILFSSSGTFSYCQNDLYKRGLKANFKIGKCLGDLHQNVDTVLHLFDHTVYFIYLYNI